MVARSSGVAGCEGGEGGEGGECGSGITTHHNVHRIVPAQLLKAKQIQLQSYHYEETTCCHFECN